MKLFKTSIEYPSPGKVRLTAEVSYDSSYNPEKYWFELPEEYADQISLSGNPWLVCLLPLAVTLGEPLKIPNPVDPFLLEGCKKLVKIWTCWYPKLRYVPIIADNIHVIDEDPQNTMAFFSGGVDSFFTILRREKIDPNNAEGGIDDLLTVGGFDIPLKNQEAIVRRSRKYAEIAELLGKNIIGMSTNLRETTWKLTNWGGLSHGCALSAAGLVLEKRFRRILIASTGGYHDLKPWGSHILTDGLMSTSKNAIVHDGGEFRRIDKCRSLIESEVAMLNLQVCYKLQSDMNCGRCSKCLRTLMTFQALGALDKCLSFNLNNYNPEQLVKIRMKGVDGMYLSEIRDVATQNEDIDLINIINKSFKHTQWIENNLRLLQRYKKTRFFWRFANFFEKIIDREPVIKGSELSQ